MNIKRAKQEIKDAIEAYLLKNEFGDYLIPSVRQRPLLLMGAPGIGKTAIMEQIARECRINLVSYTITHHTRQSAVGLPFIKEKEYQGTVHSVTEYTMSEIIAAVYECMEKTGIREGILFLDEINCVSETLAPTMLQFLQCKTFGNQAVPAGWIIAAAGNPPEYNKSVREFDVVTLDRIRKLDVEEDFAVWKEYAYEAGIHPAVISYLDIHRENFYRMETGIDGRMFATARGWEDLSQFLYACGRLGRGADREIVNQYIPHWKVAKDFANYLELFEKYKTDYQVDAILKGEFAQFAMEKLRLASFDERFSVVGLLLGKLNAGFMACSEMECYIDRLFERLGYWKKKLEQGADGLSSYTLLLEKEQDMLDRKKLAGHLSVEEEHAEQRLLKFLSDGRLLIEENVCFEPIQSLFQKEVEKREKKIENTSQALQYAFDFLELAFQEGQEMVMFVTELNTGKYSLAFIREHGCDSYYKYNKKLLFEEEQSSILDELDSIEKEL